MLCWGEPDHDGLHHSRHGNYTWPDPPERLERQECRRGWPWQRRTWTRVWTRERVRHPYGSACWLWAYRDEQGHYIEAEELVS
jgi:hypothetical protein